jgi:Peptidase S46
MQTWNAERLALSLLGVAMLACLPPRPAHSDEGMWTFDNFPSAAVKAKYGVDIDPAWLDHGAAVRLSTGCSASIVTANGIVLSNHHSVGNCGSVEGE